MNQLPVEIGISGYTVEQHALAGLATARNVVDVQHSVFAMSSWLICKYELI